MSRPQRRHGLGRARAGAGFTLVELLVVITILGLMVGLVGGIGVERLDKGRAQEEWVQTERTVRGLAFRAFAYGRPVEIAGDGARLEWSIGGEPAGRLDLVHWFVAPAQRIVINAHGVSEPGALLIRRGDVERPIGLNDWLSDAD